MNFTWSRDTATLSLNAQPLVSVIDDLPGASIEQALSLLDHLAPRARTACVSTEVSLMRYHHPPAVHEGPPPPFEPPTILKETWTVTYQEESVHPCFCNLEPMETGLCLRVQATSMSTLTREQHVDLLEARVPAVYITLRSAPSREHDSPPDARLVHDGGITPFPLCKVSTPTLPQPQKPVFNLWRFLKEVWDWMSFLIAGFQEIFQDGGPDVNWGVLWIIVPLCAPIAGLVHLAKRRFNQDIAEAEEYIASFVHGGQSIAEGGDLMTLTDGVNPRMDKALPAPPAFELA